MADTPQEEQRELFEIARQPEPPAPEVPETAAVEVPPEAPPVSPPAEPVEAGVPSWRLREETEARRQAEDRARALETRLNEIAAHLQQQQKKPDFFENPNQATEAIIQQHLQRRDEEEKAYRLYLGRQVAQIQHGADKVKAAEDAFIEAMNSRALDPMDYERVVSSPNRYDSVVEWHNRHSVVTTVGNDPKAWFAKQLEASLADPKFQAEMLEKIRGSAATKPGTVQIPPSLSRTTAAAGNGQEPVGDMSDASLFAYAMRR
jgi:hypothetical protein